MILDTDTLISDATSRDYVSLSQPRILTTTLTQEEIATLEGDRFYASYDVTLATSETQYILFDNPVGSGVDVGLEFRTFKTFDEAAEMEILWDYTYTTKGASITVFNENNNYRDGGSGNETGNKFVVNLIPVANVTAEGIIRETDFIPAAGVGANASGAVAVDFGFRIYKPGTGFMFKVTNLDATAANRVLIAYSWIEAPTTL